MISFIEKLVEELSEKYGKDLGELCVVFPSRRACVFFKDALQRSLSTPSWSPGVFAIEDFAREVHPRTILDQVSLTFELYPLYREHFPDEAFDKYYSWGSTLVSDFDEIDLYRVDAQSIFRNLFELKAIDATIDSWLEEGQDLTEFQARYLQFWELMGSFYEGLRKKLDAQHKASPGMAMRELADQFEASKPALPWQHIVFAGLNALTPAEEGMIKALVDHGLAECYWDLDSYYINNEFQEAGHFFRSLRERWKLKDWSWIEDHLSKGEKKITLTGVPQRVGQAKVAGLKLRSWLDTPEPDEKTALVLGDENLLFPVLHSLPLEYDKVNVTMGYPLRNTPLYSLIDTIIQLHENAERLRPGRTSKVYYCRDVMNILRHPYIASILRETSRDLLYEIERENLVYISPKLFDRFKEEDKEHLLSFLFQPWTQIDQVVDYFLNLYRRLKLELEKDKNGKGKGAPTLEAEYLFHFYTLTQKLRDKLDAYVIDFELKVFRRLYKEVIQNSSIPFSGEPLEGLQVMGMLETRALDFDRVMMLSVNEGILPSKPNTVSFIPYSLRKGFQLPTHEDKDAIYAYHFYRLLQRAKEVTIVFNTEPDTFGSGEKSRFIAQLEAEMPEQNPDLELLHETVTFPLDPEKILPIVVDKEQGVLDTLKAYVEEKGFSPSALSTYFNCPLQFYYRYVLRLREQEELEESMEENTFGSVLHGVLEELYQPFIEKEVSPEEIKAFEENLDKVIEDQFRKVTRTENSQYGRNRLLLGVIRNLVAKLLAIDESQAPFKVQGLELELETLLPTLKIPEGVKLRGYIDRVDEVDGETRIIDYKTGKVNRLDLKGFEQIREGAKKREPFQLSTYAYLYLRNHPETKEVSPGIYFMRNLSEGLRYLETGPTKAKVLDLESLLDYESEMVSLIDEIFDPEIPFSQTEEFDRCRFCSYKVMCSRP